MRSHSRADNVGALGPDGYLDKAAIELLELAQSRLEGAIVERKMVVMVMMMVVVLVPVLELVQVSVMVKVSMMLVRVTGSERACILLILFSVLTVFEHILELVELLGYLDAERSQHVG